MTENHKGRGDNDRLVDLLVAIIGDMADGPKDSPLMAAYKRIQRELCDQGLCVEAQASREVGYINAVVHTVPGGLKTSHVFARTAASSLDELKACNSIRLDGSSVLSEATSTCPVCGMSPIPADLVEVVLG